MRGRRGLVGGKPAIPPQEAKVLVALTEGKTPVDAVKEGGYDLTPKNSETLAKEIWRRHVTANGSMVEALAQVGVDPQYVAEKIKDLLEAEHTVVTKDGVIEVPDNVTRLKAVDVVLKTTGAYAPKASVQADLKFEHILFEIDDERENDNG